MPAAASQTGRQSHRTHTYPLSATNHTDKLGDQPVRIWCDNEAAVLVSKDATSIKRLAYIARRCRFLQELTERGDIRLLNVPGTANPADALTKHVSPKSTFRSYMARIYQGTADQF